MADLFITKERLKFALILTSIGMLLAGLATWYFWTQIEFETDRNRFLLSAVITGTLAVGACGQLLFYLHAKRIVDPSHNFLAGMDSFPWGSVMALALLVFIGAAGWYVFQHSQQAMNEFELLRSGQLDALQERIETQPSVLEHKDARSGNTLLQVAYNENHPQAVRLLLQSGVPATEIKDDGVNPIVESLQNLPMLGALLDGGLDPESPAADGISPMHHLVSMDATNALDRLLQGGAKVDSRDPIFRTPLMRAVEMDLFPMAERIIQHNADVNAFDQRGDTALHIAVRRRKPESINLLIASEADPRVFNFAHLTPLHIAAQAGQTNLVSIFLEIPDITGLHDEADRTPLDLALQSRKYEVASLLLEGGADINRVDQKGNTSLHNAIESRDYRTARFLIRAGASASIPNKTGKTALDIMHRKQLAGLIELVEKRNNPEASM